nr:ribonuclease H-like domain-containing protein [Tanacetum cinerariifolium]
MDPCNHSTPISTKLLILDTGKFEQWRAPPEETTKDKGPAGEVSSSTKKKGKTLAITAEDMQKRKNDVKARTTLLLALNDEHQLRFSKYDSTKELWEAILKTFGRNEATKKTKKNQLKQQYGNFKAEGSETLEQIFSRLQVIVSHLEFMDVPFKQDDLNQKFLTSITPEWLVGKSEVSTIEGASTASAQVPTVSTDVAPASLSYDTICAFIATQPNGSQIKYEDISQIDDDDIEKMDIKWNLALWDWSYMDGEDEASKNHALMADEEEVPTEYALMTKSSSSSDNEVKKEKESIDFKIEKIKHASKDLERLLESQKLDKDKMGVGFNEYCDVPPPLAYVYSPPMKDLSWMGLLKFVDDIVTDYTRPTPSIDVSKSINQKFPLLAQKLPLLSQQLLLIRKTREKLIRPQLVGFGNLGKLLLVKDSGCSRHMTGNISYLYEYEPFNGGYVSFGNGKGKITSKGLIKTGKLEFENVYFMEELKYNLFNVSQICDNKNSILFTDTEFLVLGKYFKLIDDKHVLLRTPRQHNMYTIDLKNVVPHKNSTCLIAKASVNESMLWHRRLGHLLVRSNLVKGLPSKSFENNHSCVAFLKGKKHKASLRTMLADAKLSVTFWAEAVNTACYVQNRVLVIKPHNKTPYEIFNERSHAIGFLRPFGCHVMILNTLDHLGKFDAKGDEGYFVGYSLSSKAIKVFNKRTKNIEENFHVDFLENKSIKKGTGIKEDVHHAVKEKESPLRFIALPNLFHKAQMATSNEAAKKDDAIPDNNSPQKEQQEVNGDKEVLESSRNSNPTASTKVSTNDSFELASSSTVETEVPTVSLPVLTDSLFVPLVTSSVPIIISRGGSSFPEPLYLGNAMSFENRLEDLFRDTSNAVSLNEVEADLSNMETAIQVSPTLTLKIHKDHPKSQIIGAVDTLVQTRQKTKNPPGFQDLEFPQRVYKIEKAMYGVHQALRAWYGTLSKYLLDNGFQKGIIYQEVQRRVFACTSGKDGTGKDVDLYLYRSMIGSLMYLTTSRPDIMFVVCAYVRHQVTPKECHLHAVKRILDSDYGGANQDRKSTTGGCQFLGRRLISWQCKKQTIIATSTTEAEYVAVASGCGQVLWIQNQLLDYGVKTTDEETKILAQVNGRQRIISESSIRRHLKLNDEEDQDEPIHHEPVPQSHEQTTSQEPTIPSQSHSVITTPRTITSGSIRISQSKVPLPGVEETAFLAGDVTYREAFLTDTSLDVGQDKENIAKTSAMPHEALPRLKTRIKNPEDNERRREGFAQEDAPNTEGMDQGEDLFVGDTVKDSDKSADKGSDSTDEMANVLGTLGAANILASRGLRLVFTTTSLLVATASTCIFSVVATASGSFHTASIFTTANVATPTTRVTRSSRGVVIGSSSPISANIPSISNKDKGKRKMTEPEQPKRIKKLKSTEASGTESTQEQQSEEPKELSEEELKKIMELVLVEELYIEALHVKYPIIDWEIYSEGQRNTTEVTDKKTKELWVELKRLYEPDSKDPQWALQRLSVPTADDYIAKKLATVEDFALLHEDKIYPESKMSVCYIYNVVCDYSINLGELVSLDLSKVTITLQAKEPSPGFGTSSPSASVNIEVLRADEELVLQPTELTADFGGIHKPELFVVHLVSVATRIKNKKCKTKGGSSRPHMKRKLASWSLNSRATHAKTSTSKDDVLFLTVSDDDKELLDLHDRCYARQVVVDNAVNRRSCELPKPTVIALWENISTLSTEVQEHKANLDMMMLESQKVGDEEVVVGEGVVVTSSLLEMLTNSYLGGIMVSLIFLEGLEEEVLEEFMVELFEEDDKMSKKYG